MPGQLHLSSTEITPQLASPSPLITPRIHTRSFASSSRVTRNASFPASLAVQPSISASASPKSFSEGSNGKDSRLFSAAKEPPPGLEIMEFDIVIVGAGIIGLSIANLLLSDTNMSVAIVDAARPCAGATGAGQGYVWLGHKSPALISWPLSVRSNYLWSEFAKELQQSGLEPQSVIGYKKTGSLLFGTSSDDACRLQKRSNDLRAGGVEAEFLNSAALHEVEPHLNVGADGSAVFTPDDCQIDAQLTALYLTTENKKYCSSGRFQEIYYDPVTNFLWSDQHSHVAGVQTTRREIHCKEQVIMAAGAWSGELMKKLFNRLSLPHVLATKPRKGHLLVLEGLSDFSLRHGLMEATYEDLAESSSSFGIASTATTDATGRLLLGSSRQFTGFDFSLQYDVMEAILKKAARYLPVLGNIHLAAALKTGSVRVGHRPYVPDGRPMIGEIPGLGRLLLATGHEGEGLTLSLATAEIVVNMILGREQIVDPAPFSPKGRLVARTLEDIAVQ